MSRPVYYDVDGNELDESEVMFEDEMVEKGIITPEELLEIKERLSKIERIIFGGTHD